MVEPEKEGVNRIVDNISRNWVAIRHRLKVFTIIFVLFCLVLTAYFFNRIFINIYPGHSGVLWKRFHGGTDMEFVYNEGLHIIPPWDRMYIYDVRNQHHPFTFEALSKDGLPIKFEVSVRYRPERLNLPLLHTTVGPDYVEKVVQPEVQAHVRKVVANYFPEEIYTSEGYLLQIIMQGAMVAINEKYIILDNLLIRKMTLPKVIADAIERKLSQQQYVLELEYRLQSEAKEALRKAIEAEGIKRFQDIVKAGGFFDKYLQFKGIEATLNLAKSDNSKVVVIGGGRGNLPIILNMDSSKEKSSDEADAVPEPEKSSSLPKPLQQSETERAAPPTQQPGPVKPSGNEPEDTFLLRIKEYLDSAEKKMTSNVIPTSGKAKAP